MADTSTLTNPLRAGLRMQRTPEPCTMVIFGATGDLTHRKLAPALYNLHRERLLPPGFNVVGFARRDWTDDYFRESLKQEAQKYSRTGIEGPLWDSFAEGIFFNRAPFDDPAGYQRWRNAWPNSMRSAAPAAIACSIFRRRPNRTRRLLNNSALPGSIITGVGPMRMNAAGRALSLRSRSDTIWRARGRSTPTSIRSLTNRKCIVSIIIWAKRPSRILWSCVSRTVFSSRFGTGATSITCRLRWRKALVSKAGRIITKRPARCATWCRIT